MIDVYLKKGREKPVKNGHPWIFSGSILRLDGGTPAPGDSCRVLSAEGTVLGHGYYNASSSITVRMVTKGDVAFGPDELKGRLSRAIAARKGILASADAGNDSCRLVNAEGDFLPGLIVDTFAGGLSVQINTMGMHRLRTGIIAELTDRCNPSFIYEKTDDESTVREGMQAAEGLLSGSLPVQLVIRENGLRFSVDIAGGQKTGFYFDQRENRGLVRSYAGGRRCLDCFCYSGAFTANMLSGEAASVTSVDLSKNAVAWCRETVALNGFDASRTDCVSADVFEYLRGIDAGYELIVLDPPKFARHPGEVERAARGYKDINLVAMKKIAPGGILFSFSCSNAIDQKLFRQIVFAAAADAGRQVQLLHVLTAGTDHPVNLSHPEGEYLKGLVMRVY
jgi:23S rRNA (cytosine1962-C5)-methyltransferase